MGWNHRLFARECGPDKEIYLSIHEAYYKRKGDTVPDSYTEDAIDVGGENLESISWTLDKIQECLSKPILWYGDRFPEEYKPK